MIGTLITWGLLDVFLYVMYGNAATESATTWYYGYLFPSIPLFVGMLMGHFFGQDRAPSAQGVTPPAWRKNGEIVLLAIMVPWILFDMGYIVSSHAPPAVDEFVWGLVGHQVLVLFLVGVCFGSMFLPMNEPTTFQPEEK